MMKIVPVLVDRINVYGDIRGMIDSGEFGYFFEAPTYDSKDLLWRDETGTERTKGFLAEVIAVLEKAPDESFTDVEKTKALIWDFATLHGRGAVLWPIRFALTGKLKSPDPFTLLTILGKKESTARLKHAEKSLQ